MATIGALAWPAEDTRSLVFECSKLVVMRPSRSSLLAGVAVAVALLAAGASCSRPAPSCQRKPDPKAESARLDFSLQDPSGATVALSSFKGQPLIINFWATYCGPCKAEIPVFNEMMVEHRAERLAVIGISYDDKPADIVT